MVLDGRRAIVTGASKGIGRALALAMAEQGARLVVNARGDGLDDLVAEITDLGGSATAVRGSIAQPETARILVESCTEKWGGVDIVVNNAAVLDLNSLGPVTGCNPDLWEQTIAANLTGPYRLCREALPLMVKQRWGRILNAGSLAGTGLIGGSAYAASKSGIFGLTRAIAGDYGPYGITANVYNPEARTSMGGADDPAVFEARLAAWVDRGFCRAADLPYLRTVGGPDGVVPFLLYLCSDEAEYFNGEIFALEGRKIAMLPWFEEERTLMRNHEAHGSWSLSELSEITPATFPVSNRWPRRSEAELQTMERGD